MEPDLPVSDVDRWMSGCWGILANMETVRIIRPFHREKSIAGSSPNDSHGPTLGTVEVPLTIAAYRVCRAGVTNAHFQHCTGYSLATSIIRKSKIVTPGLADRGLSLPPGIAAKLEGGGTAPAGIAKRFPAATVQVGTPTPETTGNKRAVHRKQHPWFDILV